LTKNKTATFKKTLEGRYLYGAESGTWTRTPRKALDFEFCNTTII